jgi:replication factor C subunit 3/5
MSQRNLRRAILALEACKVQKYPFTKNQEVPEIDWQRFLNETALDLVRNQSPSSLEKVRGQFYELLSHGIPSDVIFKGLVKELNNKVEAELKAQIYTLASLYEYRMQQGSKKIYHLEAFAAHFMSIYKKYMVETAEMMDLDD